MVTASVRYTLRIAIASPKAASRRVLSVQDRPISKTCSWLSARSTTRAASHCRSLGERRAMKSTFCARRLSLCGSTISPESRSALFSTPAHAVFAVFDQDAHRQKVVANCVSASEVALSLRQRSLRDQGLDLSIGRAIAGETRQNVGIYLVEPVLVLRPT